MEMNKLLNRTVSRNAIFHRARLHRQIPLTALMSPVLALVTLLFGQAIFATNPDIDLVKTAGTAADSEVLFISGPGSVTYHYEVINTGNTNLSDIIIVDNGGTLGDPSDDVILTAAECSGLAGQLAPSASVTCTADIFVSRDVANLAEATGNPTDPGGADLPGLDDVEAIDNALVIIEEPAAITLIAFTAQADSGQISLLWETGSEIENAGFNLHRAGAANGPYVKINEALIPAQGSAFSGAGYTYIDSAGEQGITYYYKLEDVDIHGISTLHGPISVAAAVSTAPDGGVSIYLPLLFRSY